MSIIQMNITASILILVIVVVRALVIHKLPKKAFVILWGLVLLRLLMPFSIPLPFNLNITTDWITETQTISPNIIELSNIDAINNLLEPTISDGVAQNSPALFIWIIGIIACALFFLVTHFRCRREYKATLPIYNEFINEWLKCHKIRRSIQIRQSDVLNTPMTYGIWKPVILFPKATDWQDEVSLRYVLTHEMTHIKRLDILSKWLLAATLCVHWFNPLVWVMYILANRDIELSCDENVILTFGETIKSAYALALIGLEEKKSGFSPLFNNFAKNAIEERITSIMKMKKVSLIGVISAFVLVSTLTVAVLAASATNANNQTDSSLTNDPSAFQFDENITYEQEQGIISNAILTQATENSIRTNLLTFEGIDEAYVKLVIDETNSSDIFVTTSNSSASILLTTNRTISEDEATKIATLVSKSVKDLQIENIQIIDQNENVLFSEPE